jgi:ATP-binding cassette, subfamily F, member 3
MLSLTLNVSQVSKFFGIDPILEDVSFSLNNGERLGLVGPNGSGKTTLMRIIAGLDRPDAGAVRRTPADLRLGYLAQGFAPDPGDTLASFLARMEGDLPGLTQRLEVLAHTLAENPDQPNLQQEYDTVLADMARVDESIGRGPVVLAALGLDSLPGDLPVSALSGGQKTRLSLAGVLLSNPQVLLLDEPTNHLDIAMLEWLEKWLADFPFSALIVSHDRTFLDDVATGILDLDPLTRTVKRYEGNYSDYLETKQAERERQWQAYTDQQGEIGRLKTAATHMRSLAKVHKGGKADPKNTDGFSVGHFANRGKESIQKAKNIEKRIEHMLTDERVDRPAQTWQMKVDWGETGETGRDVLVMEDLAVGYGDTVLLQGVRLTLRQGGRIALIGPNGTGKTTLVRVITGQLEPLAGRLRLGSNVRLGYMAQDQENLDYEKNALETIGDVLSQNQTEVRSFLSKFLFRGDDVFTPVGKLSYGERARLTLARLVAQGCNFLVLDEPVNHLDIPARARFEQSLRSFEGSVLAVLHDRYFIEAYANEIWEVRDGEIVTRERL